MNTNWKEGHILYELNKLLDEFTNNIYDYDDVELDLVRFIRTKGYDAKIVYDGSGQKDVVVMDRISLEKITITNFGY